MIGAAAFALGASSLLRRRVELDPLVLIPALLLLLLAPLPALSLGLLGGAVVRFRRAAAATRSTARLATDAVEAGDLIGLGLAGGLSTAGACALARQHCSTELAPVLDRLTAAMERRGVVPALAADRGPLAGISSVLVTATASGASALATLDAHLRQEHHRRHMAQVEEARRLPIRLLIPLTLLVLPGFVLIVIGPAVIDSLARLSP